MHRFIGMVLVVVLVSAPVSLDAASIPSGTVVPCELEEPITSRKSETSLGRMVAARVARDVHLEGRTVIEAGTPVAVKVSDLRPARIAGRKGMVELRAVSTHSVDGAEVRLSGVHQSFGKGRKALAIGLFFVVWPLIFIKGKHAQIPAGATFDALIDAEADLETSAKAR